MADDIMPEEAARRRRLGEIRRMAMRYPVMPEVVDAAIERQRAAARDMVNREARRLPVPSGGREVVPVSGGGGRGVVPPGGREVIPSPGDRMPMTTGEAETGRDVSPRRRMTINPQIPERAARSLARRALGPAALALDVADPTAVADATLRGNPQAGIQPYGGTRFNDEPVRAELPPTIVTAEADGEIAARNQRRNVQRPATRMSPRQREMTAEELNQRELDRIAAARGVLSGGDIQPRELNLDERIGASMDRTLGRIGLRRTNETGEGAPSTGSFREDLRGLGRALGLKKGGKVKKMAKGGVVKAPSASRRGDGIAARGKTKGRMV